MKNIIGALLFFVSLVSFGQASSNTDSLNSEGKEIVVSVTKHSVDMADTLRAEGKIYVVVLVILILIFGLFTYLVMADKRLKKLEEEFKASNK